MSLSRVDMTRRPSLWVVRLADSGFELGHVEADHYETALAKGIVLAAKSDHPPQCLEVQLQDERN
jgi:NOL1/NOP2/fmu family ribosome biogenesis protein